MSKINLALIHGGRSGEHEVSLVSAAYVLRSLAPEKYNVHPVRIDHDGRWFKVSLDAAKAAADQGSLPKTGGSPCALVNRGAGPVLEVRGDADEDIALDFAFPMLHGTFGEDGRMQGLFEALNLPFAGSGTAGSAMAMDKIAARRICAALDIPQPDFRELSKTEFAAAGPTRMSEIASALNFPLFVKPANLGSSVGVSKAVNLDELQRALEEAFKFDHRAIIEVGMDVRELEVGVLGNTEASLSTIGEVIVHANFYSYDAKYENEQDYDVQVPADIPANIEKQMRETAVQAYHALNCAGFARADFFYVEDENRLYFNEINTIPGCTPISMFPRLWKHAGVDGPELMDRIVEFGLERHRRDGALTYNFSK